MPEEEEPVQRQAEENAFAQEAIEEEEDALQTKAGAVTPIQRLCAGCEQQKATLQPKLTVGPAHDAYEQEADRVADHVANTLQTQSMSRVQPQVNRPTITPLVMRQGEGVVAPSPQVEQGIQQSRGGGEAIDQPIRNSMEQAFGANFSGVKIHADGEADQLNRSLNARAFTTGQDIYFKQGEYRPSSQTGQKLLAHELTHTVQQASHLMRSELLHDSTSSSLSIQREDDPGSTTASDEAICEALRSAFDNSRQVIALYREFLAGDVSWDEVREQTRQIGNAAEGVSGAGHNLPQEVQNAIEEVESFGFEEIGQGGALLWEFIFGDDASSKRQWVRNEIERQHHFNLVLIRLMYENSCPDFPGTWRGFQEQVLSIGTRGQVSGTTPVQPPRETRTALAWVETGSGNEALILATEVAGSGRLRFVRWIDREFQDLALQQAQAKQGSIPSVPGTAVNGLPSSVPSSATRR